ncbi:MAG: hypothetical protein MSA47_03520 [Christensenellaceae bacterium]|nr:hypothetical protein [Christensenellaceae bacterium]
MKKITVALITFMTVCFACGFSSGERQSARAYDIYSLFKDGHLRFYENELAKEKVYSQYSDSELSETAHKHNISVDKLKKVIVFQHMMHTVGKEYSVEDVLKAGNRQIVGDLKSYVEFLKKTKSEEELKELEIKFKEAGRE